MGGLARYIRGIRILDPAHGRDELGDLVLAQGRIQDPQTFPLDQIQEELDGKGLFACPAFIETSFQAHTPGHGRDGDLGSELRAAAAGGFAQVLLRPDTNPVADHPGVLWEQRQLAAREGLLRVHLSAALTHALAGESLSELGGLADAGAKAFSQALQGIPNSRILRLALEYAADLRLPVFLFPEDSTLAAHGVMDEGPTSLRLGLAGRPIAAEEIGVERDLRVAANSGARIHFPHLSSAAAIARVAAARHRGQAVSCAVSLHHLLLQDHDVGYFQTAFKTLPPLRSQSNREALLRALANGAIQALTSAHTPWGRDWKGMTFAQAPFGIGSIEWTIPLALRLVQEGVADLLTVLGLLTVGPARILGLAVPDLRPGSPADLCIIDPDAAVIPASNRWSRAYQNPYVGWPLQGQLRYLFVDGRLVFLHP